MSQSIEKLLSNRQLVATPATKILQSMINLWKMLLFCIFNQNVVRVTLKIFRDKLMPVHMVN